MVGAEPSTAGVLLTARYSTKHYILLLVSILVIKHELAIINDDLPMSFESAQQPMLRSTTQC